MYPDWGAIERANEELSEFFTTNYPNSAYCIGINVWGRPWASGFARNNSEVQLSLLHHSFKGGCKLVTCPIHEMLEQAKKRMPKREKEA